MDMSWTHQSLEFHVTSSTLGLLLVLGMDMPSGAKTMAKSGFAHPLALQTAEDFIEKLKGHLSSSLQNLLS